jgi:hypothetical protein
VSLALDPSFMLANQTIRYVANFDIEADPRERLNRASLSSWQDERLGSVGVVSM